MYLLSCVFIGNATVSMWRPQNSFQESETFLLRVSGPELRISVLAIITSYLLSHFISSKDLHFKSAF